MNTNLLKQVKIRFKNYQWEVIIGLLLMILYGPLVFYWCQGWLDKSIGIEHDYFNHGLIGLPFAAYLISLNRKKWQRLPDKFNLMGGIFLISAGFLYLTNLADFVNLSLPLMLGGICLWLKGVSGLKLQGMALIFILFSTPNHIPYLIEPFALPLQKFITEMAGLILNIFGLNVVIDQIYLSVDNRIVEVAPHCAGLKILFTSLYVALMLVYWTGLWQSKIRTICFLLITVLISVAGNILRNTLLTLFYVIHQEGLFAWLHEGWGGDVYSACMLGLLILVVNGIEYYFPMEPPVQTESDGQPRGDCPYVNTDQRN